MFYEKSEAAPVRPPKPEPVHETGDYYKCFDPYPLDVLLIIDPFAAEPSREFVAVTMRKTSANLHAAFFSRPEWANFLAHDEANPAAGNWLQFQGTEVALARAVFNRAITQIGKGRTDRENAEFVTALQNVWARAFIK